MSGVGQVEEANRCARCIVEAAVAKETSIRSQVESRVASLVVHAKASTAQAVSALSECMKEVAVHMEEQTSCIVGAVAQQLKKEIEAFAVTVATTSEKHTRSAVYGLHEEVMAHLDQNRAASRSDRRKHSNNQWHTWQLVWKN
ncbi:MAG: hypothetical protein MI921_02615 [Cytophagales bacterium]|nr:hypothetical protein [Cytophagales bacterium]